ncbi:MAG: exosortase-associated EpsI family protein [Candidatus Didemnitutus sp.]|nr:exosortase-associated EpsI family protein [Candidatus Didemnitutus sp.]
MTKSQFHWLSVAGLAVLAAAVFLQFSQVRNASEGDIDAPRNAHYFEGKIPRTVSGWNSQELPLGVTELLQGQVAAILNFDAYVFREFRRGGARFAVYAAYWSPGRMPVSRVVSHTPDRCWTENGWNCESMTFNEVWNVEGIGMFAPNQRRIFQSPTGETEHVVFWHLVEGRSFDFGDRFTAITDPKMWLKQTVAYAVAGSGEQCFVRVTSDRPLDQFADDPGWREILHALAGLGLVPRNAVN